MNGTSDDGFRAYDEFQGVLDPEAVDQLSRRRITNEPTPLNSALRHLDSIAGNLVDPTCLAEAIDDDGYAEYAESMFAVDIGDPKERLRMMIARAWRATWEMSIKYETMDKRDQIRSDLVAIGHQIAALHGRAQQLATSAGIAPLDPTQLKVYLGGLGEAVGTLTPSPGPVAYSDPRYDLIEEAGIEVSTQRELDDLFDLISVTPEGRPSLNTGAASFYADQSEVEALQEAISNFASPNDLGPVSFGLIDFYTLRLAELYAFGFAEDPPTYYNRHWDGGRDKDFMLFLVAAFGLVGLKIPSREMLVRHWREFPGVKRRLKYLASVAKVVRDGGAPSRQLDCHRDLSSLIIYNQLASGSFDWR